MATTLLASPLARPMVARRPLAEGSPATAGRSDGARRPVASFCSRSINLQTPRLSDAAVRAIQLELAKAKARRAKLDALPVLQCPVSCRPPPVQLPSEGTSPLPRKGIASGKAEDSCRRDHSKAKESQQESEAPAQLSYMLSPAGFVIYVDTPNRRLFDEDADEAADDDDDDESDDDDEESP